VSARQTAAGSTKVTGVDALLPTVGREESATSAPSSLVRSP